jgi:hypothetical protein
MYGDHAKLEEFLDVPPNTLRFGGSEKEFFMS